MASTVNRRDFMAGAFAAAATSRSSASTASRRRQSSGGGDERLRSAQVLAFDVFGTVVDWRGGVIAAGEALGRTKGLKVDWAAFADAWRGGYGPSMNRVRRGELPWTKLDALHRMTLDELLIRFKIDGLSEDEKVRFNRAWHRLDPWPDAVEGLERLRRRFVIAPLSNGNVSLLTHMARHARLPWDCILSAELVRHYKPAPETYLMVSAFFDLEPGDVMMVAAHQGDLEAAKKLGLKTAYVHRPREFGLGREPEKPPAGRFDMIAADFRDLAAQLDA